MTMPILPPAKGDFGLAGEIDAGGIAVEGPSISAGTSGAVKESSGVEDLSGRAETSKQ
jgi:hypothetical protein